MSAIQFSRLENGEGTRPKNTTLDEAVELIRGDALKLQVELIRIKYTSVLKATNDPTAAKKAVEGMKLALPAFMPHGTFSRRGNKNIERHSGLIQADLDHVDGAQMPGIRAKLVSDPHVAVVYTSPTGTGLKALYRVPADKDRHHASFRAVGAHVLQLCGVQIDKSCKNEERLCYAGWDPDAHYNPDAVELPVSNGHLILKCADDTKAPKPKASMEKVKASLKAIPADDYGQWIEKGIALKRELGDDGLAVWIEWSKSSSKYQPGKCEEKWASMVVDDRPNPIGVGTIVHDAKQADEETLQRLAKLSVIEYDRIREDEAGKLKVRVGTLDKLVADRRPPQPAQTDNLGLADVVPWPDPVDGGELLAQVSDTFNKYLALPDGAADVLALWTAHCHCFEWFVHSPRVNLFSPEKGCGKTTAIDVIASMVPRPLRTESITAAVLFRLVELYKPTLLLDECDAYLPNAEELRGLLNAGHKRGARAYRCEGDDHEVKAYNAFAPAVLAGIGALPGTLHDRSVVIRLQRAKPGEVQTRFDSRRTADEQELCRKLARWVADNRDQIESADPVMPPGAFNRLADNWRPLFAIADAAGPEWRNMVEKAFALLVSQDDSDAHGLGVMLLTDIESVFHERGGDRMFSKHLVEALVGMTDRPWPEARGIQGKPITEAWLARKLRPFGVHPKGMRIEDDRAKGYELADFKDSFDRFLPESPLSGRDTVTTPENID